MANDERSVHTVLIMHTFPSGAFRVFRTLHVAVDKHYFARGATCRKFRITIEAAYFFQAVPNAYRSLKCVSECMIFFYCYDVSLKAISGKTEEA